MTFASIPPSAIGSQLNGIGSQLLGMGSHNDIKIDALQAGVHSIHGCFSRNQLCHLNTDQLTNRKWLRRTPFTSLLRLGSGTRLAVFSYKSTAGPSAANSLLDSSVLEWRGILSLMLRKLRLPRLQPSGRLWQP